MQPTNSLPDGDQGDAHDQSNRNVRSAYSYTRCDGNASSTYANSRADSNALTSNSRANSRALSNTDS